MEIFDILRYELDARQNLDIDDTYTEIANVTMSNAVLGDYEHTMSLTHSYDQTNSSAFFRFSIDGGVTWDESTLAPDDKLDRTFTAYSFVRVGESGNINLQIQARKEDSDVGILTVHSVNAWIKRIG